MATIKTIKPAGGGDYTTLQAWEDWADGEAAADQHAECYAGDCGAIMLSGWTSTPTSSLHPIIYAATGNQHDGTNTPSGAKIVSSGSCFYAVDFLYVEVIGIYFDWYDDGFGAACVNVSQGAATTQVFRFDRCVFDREQGGRSNNVIESTCNGFSVNSNSTHRVTNCVFYNKGAAGGNALIVGFSNQNQSRTILWEVINNTAPGLATLVPYGFYFGYEPNNTVTVVLMNNAVYGTTTCFAGVNIDTATGGYNASSDATADDIIATGALINRTAATDFVSSTSSPEIDPAGGLDGAGTDGSAYTTVDIRGQTRSVPWNIGAWQDAAAELGFPLMGTSALQLFITV